jgi:hypothetical protein
MAGQIRRRITMVTVALATACGLAFVPVAPATADTIAACWNPSPPDWFYTRLSEAASRPGDAVPSSWGDSLNMARIVCRESVFNPRADRNYPPYYGLGQLSAQSLAQYSDFSWDIYVNGTSEHPPSYYQLLAALRYAQGRYGDPWTGWQQEVNAGYW